MELACADVVRNFIYMGYMEHVTVRELDFGPSGSMQLLGGQAQVGLVGAG